MTKRKKTITFLRIAILVLAFFRVRHRYGSLQEGLLLLIEQIHTTRWFIVLFAIFFVVRPLLLIPVGMLSVVAGVLRGRWPGLPLVLV